MATYKRYADVPRSIPTWAATVGAMQANQVIATASCPVCRFYKRLDLLRIIEAKGADYSLFDKRLRCKAILPAKIGGMAARCTGVVTLMYGSKSGPMRLCSTER